MDMQKIPAVQQKRIVTFVNHFIIDTVTVLNRLINSSEDTLWRLEKRMRKLETTLKLLETKLSFIPDDVEEKSTASLPASEIVIEVKDNESDTPNSEDREDTPQESASVDTTEIEIPPEIQKYHKLVRVGVPVQAVKLKMQREGFDPNLLPQH